MRANEHFRFGISEAQQGIRRRRDDGCQAAGFNIVMFRGKRFMIRLKNFSHTGAANPRSRPDHSSAVAVRGRSRRQKKCGRHRHAAKLRELGAFAEITPLLRIAARNAHFFGRASSPTPIPEASIARAPGRRMRGPVGQVAGNRFVSPKRRLRQKTGRFDFQAFRALGVHKVKRPLCRPL